MRCRIFLVAVLLLSAASLLGADFPKVGEPAPAFTLKNQDSKEFSLKDFSGKWLVLYFYPKDFTTGCTLEAQSFQRDLAKYEAKGAVIVGVSVDTAESHKAFCAKEGLNFHLLADTDAVVSNAYNSAMVHEGTTYSVRNTFLIDPQGKVARVFPKVKPAGHSAEVLAAIDELKAR